MPYSGGVLSLPKPQDRTAVVEAATALSPSVRGLVLALDGDAHFDYVAGQYVSVRLAGIDEKRDYSIANAKRTDNRLELAVTKVDGGPVSSALHTLPVGAELAVSGPHGLFVRSHLSPEIPTLFVGTGTGLAPLRAMIQEELAARPHSGPRIQLLFGCRSAADQLWREELSALAAVHSRFRYDVTLSRPDEGWTGKSGYVQTHLAAELATIPDANVFVCGLSKMVGDVRKVLKHDLGLDRRRVHSERYD